MGGPSGVIMAGKIWEILCSFMFDYRRVDIAVFKRGLDNDGPSHHLEDMSICEPIAPKQLIHRPLDNWGVKVLEPFQLWMEFLLPFMRDEGS